MKKGKISGLVFLWLMAIALVLCLTSFIGLSGWDASLFPLRLSRGLMAFLTGAGLCLVTYVLQNFTRNPLTSEYTLGISAASSFFASLGFILGASPIAFSLFGGVGVTFLLFSVARKRVRGNALVLLGIALNIVFASGISFFNYLTGFKSSQSLSRWIFGGFSFFVWEEVAVMGFLVLVMLVLFLWKHPQITLISISESYEEILGKRFQKYYFIILFMAGFFISISTTLSGPIPFFALLMVSFLRHILRGHPVKTIWLNFTLGGLFLLLLDFGARQLRPVEEIPLGVLTGLLGVPFLLILFFQKRRV